MPSGTLRLVVWCPARADTVKIGSGQEMREVRIWTPVSRKRSPTR
ncbi:MAG: hypothetical protein ACI8RZ_007453, partial [Myxococcota bacterium]